MSHAPLPPVVSPPRISGTVRPGAGIGQYRPAEPVTLVLNAGIVKKASTAAQILKLSDERSPFTQSARIAAALNHGGRSDVTERLCLPLDLARRHVGRPWGIELVADTERDDLREDGTANELRLVAPDLRLQTREQLATARRYLADKERTIVSDQIEAAALREAIAEAEGTLR